MAIGYRQKVNGNTSLEPAQPVRFHVTNRIIIQVIVMPAQRGHIRHWSSIVFTVPTKPFHRKSLEANCRIHGGCMTCMETSGNGAGTGKQIIQRDWWSTMSARKRVLTASSGAAPLVTPLNSADQPIALGSSHQLETSTRASALSEMFCLEFCLPKPITPSRGSS